MSEAVVFLAPPAVLALLLVGIHAYLGLHVLRRDVIFVDIGLSQVAALGTAISMFFFAEERVGISLIFSLGLCLFAALALALLRRFEKKISQEVLIGLTYALASGLLILVADKLPHGTEHLKHALIGNILFVTWEQILETALVYGAVGVIHFLCRRQFWAASESHSAAFFWDFVFYVLFGIVITFSTHHAGVLVVFSILVTPAALATRFCQGVRRQLIFAWISGVASVLLAFGVSYIYDLPAGAAIVSILTSLFFFILAGSHVLQGFGLLEKKS